MLRWATSPGDGYAIALVRANPLTGEILHASIRVDASIVGFTRQALRWEDERKASPAPRPFRRGRRSLDANTVGQACREAAFGMTALDLMALQGSGLPPAERERYTEELTQIIAHEMGHVLGLRHTFKGSTLHATHDLHDAEKTARSAGASVMDYNPANLAPARAGRALLQYHARRLRPVGHRVRLHALAEPGHAPSGETGAPRHRVPRRRTGPPYATDEDVSDFGWAPFATDPLAGRWDLGADPLAARPAAGRDDPGAVRSWKPGRRAPASRTRTPGASSACCWANTCAPSTRPASTSAACTSPARRATRRPRPRRAVHPVPGRQTAREALLYLRTGLFNADAFGFPPSQLLNKLADDKNIHWGMNSFGAQMEYSVTDQVRGTQRAL